MLIPVEPAEILVAHRMGRPNQNWDRIIVVRCVPDLKQRILTNAKNLKGKTNDKGKPFYVNKKLPEALAEKQREIRHQIKEVRTKEENVSKDKKTKIEVRAGVLHLNNHPVIKQVKHPSTLDLFPDKDESRKIDWMTLTPSDPVGEKGSSFVTYAAKVNNVTEVWRGYVKARKLNPLADHIAVAYMLPTGRAFYDEEHRAGWHVLQIMKDSIIAGCTAVYMVRVYGEDRLWNRRFELIEQSVKQALFRLP